ncbi:MAG: PAS domain S-box protein, partial [Candidatus Cloacimonetes bacterium]|nr:PAS domain S-box protein [Candidatus Cloacimonadota bacterium]
MADKFQKRRIAAYLVLFVSIIAIATGIYVKFIGSKIHAEDDTKVILQTIANYKKYQLVTWINERLADANALSSNLNIIQEISKLVDVPQSVSSSRFIFSRFQAYVNYKGYKSIFLIDTKGNVIFDYSGGKEIVGKNTISEALEALKYTEAIVGDYTWCNLHAERHLDVCVPIFRNYEHKSDPVAILVFRTNSSEFIEQTVTKWPHPSVTGQGILAKVENDSIYFLTQYYDNEEDGQFRSVPLSTDKKELLPILDSSPHVRLIINSFGKKAFVYTLPLKIKNWYLSVMIDYSEAMLPARNILIRSISYGVLIFIGICLILWLSLSQIRKHEVKLQQLHEIEKQTLIKHFEYIVRFTNDAVVLTNGEDRIIEFNDTALKIYKYDIEEFRQLKFSILESEKTNPQTALEENQDAKIYETLHLDKHGREIPVEISIHSFEIQDEIYVQRIIRDISERNRTEAEKKRLYQELSDTNAS